MRAGRLRHRVALQSAQELRDPAGQPIAAWTTVATVWAELWPMTGRELVAGRVEQAEDTVRWVIRYRSDVTPRHRLVEAQNAAAAAALAAGGSTDDELKALGVRIFDVNSAIDIGGRGRELELLCTESL